MQDGKDEHRVKAWGRLNLFQNNRSGAEFFILDYLVPLSWARAAGVQGTVVPLAPSGDCVFGC